MHEPNCIRFCKKCTKCGEVISIDEEEEHMEEHIEVMKKQ